MSDHSDLKGLPEAEVERRLNADRPLCFDRNPRNRGMVCTRVAGHDGDDHAVSAEPTAGRWPQQPAPEVPAYGMCTACGAVEVALVQVTGTRDLSGIGESAEYPTGDGCEVCS